MPARPHVLLSVATSIDGFIDDATPRRLVLSGEADLDRVDEVRAASDAILVGAGTVRADDPRLTVRDEARVAARVARGLPGQPLKVTLTADAALDPGLRFWRVGGPRLVYTTDVGAARLRPALDGLAEVVALGEVVDLGRLLDDLGGRGVRRLMVEGGGRLHTAFLAHGLADEVLLAVAPVLVGDAAAPRFLGPARFPGGPSRRLRLAGVTTAGDVVVLRYLPKEHS